jgi:hypothetical protein
MGIVVWVMRTERCIEYSYGCFNISRSLNIYSALNSDEACVNKRITHKY